MKKLLLILIALLPLLASAQNGQSAVKLKNGTVLKGIIKHIDPTDALTIDIAGVETQIKMSDIAEVEALKDDERQEDEPQQTVLERRLVEDDPLSEFTGFLLAKGNNVYVYSDDSEIGLAGANELKELLEADGFWNVVDNVNEAHFTIYYFVNFKKRDKAIITVSSWRVNFGMDIFKEKAHDLEVPNTNKIIAREGYDKGVKALQQKIAKMKGNSPTGDLKYFVVK